jgi:hypothetical protein
MSDNGRKCSECVNWQAPEKGDVGECRINPPTVQVVAAPVTRLGPTGMQGGIQQSMHGMFPPTNKNCWCAKFEGARH